MSFFTRKRRTASCIVLAAVLLIGIVAYRGGHMANSNTHSYIAADVVFFDDTDRHLVGRRARISDVQVVERLASYFPELDRGRRSATAGGWMPRIQIAFERPDHSITTVRVHRDLTCWSEGKGDWFTLKPGLDRAVIDLVPTDQDNEGRR